MNKVIIKKTLIYNSVFEYIDSNMYIMIENNKYDEIPICALEKHNISIDNIKTTIDESVILSKKVTKNTDETYDVEVVS